MNKLYVFGNGLDIRHHLPCKFSDFRQWLIDKYDLKDEKIYGVPDYFTNYKGLESFNKKDFAQYFLSLFDEVCCKPNGEIDWCDFEDAMGRIQWGTVIDDADPVYDKEGDIDPFKAGYNYEDMATEIAETSHILSKLFSEWIVDVENSISSDLYRKEFSVLSNDDIYLSFNYTSTLETVYGINNVNHIHGFANKYEKLVIGHGKDEFDDSYFEHNDLAVMARSTIREVFNSYRKNTNEIINRNKILFSNLQNVNEIYILGVSLNEIDEPYLQEILNCVQNECTIYLNVHKKEKFNEKANYIRALVPNKIVNIKKWLMD